MAEGSYCVEHDQSKNLLTYHDLIQQYINHEEVVEFRQSDIASLKFPLKLTSATQVDSKMSPAVPVGGRYDWSDHRSGQHAQRA